MKKPLFLAFLLVLLASNLVAQNVAQKRANTLKLGMNLSYLDNWWLGTKVKNYADFLNSAEAAKREQMFEEIAKNGFQTVRIPINFGVWANYEQPFKWQSEEGLKTADSFVKWASDNNLNAIIDLHHVELGGTIKGAAETDRIVWLWKEIATRYKNTNPDKVFFEIRNEPHEMPAEEWRKQAEEIIKAVRTIAPNHTLIVGFHDWNSRQALIDSKPFSDSSIIYTFHYYDPFVFSHQGATWAGEGLAELKDIPFPFSSKLKIETPETAQGKWVEAMIKSYEKDSDAKKMYSDLKAAKDWSVKNDVPIFLGEFGSFSKFASEESRCRHAKVIYDALGKLEIPSAWWEWDGGFNMFEKGTNRVSKCMKDAIDWYKQAKSDH